MDHGAAAPSLGHASSDERLLVSLLHCPLRHEEDAAEGALSSSRESNEGADASMPSANVVPLGSEEPPGEERREAEMSDIDEAAESQPSAGAAQAGHAPPSRSPSFSPSLSPCPPQPFEFEETDEAAAAGAAAAPPVSPPPLPAPSPAASSVPVELSDLSWREWMALRL
jgi:hypothetical protein